MDETLFCRKAVRCPTELLEPDLTDMAQLAQILSFLFQHQIHSHSGQEQLREVGTIAASFLQSHDAKKSE